MSQTEEQRRYVTAVWCASALDQAERFREALDRFSLAYAESEWQHRMATSDNPHRAEWEAHHAAEPDQTEPLTFGDSWRVLAERYFLLLALGQVHKCVDRLPDDDLPHLSDPRIVRLLRDIEEHWEQDALHPAARSLRKLQEQEPDYEPGRWAYNKHETWLSQDVTLDDVTLWVTEVETAVRAAGAAADQTIPAAPDRIPTESPGLDGSTPPT